MSKVSKIAAGLAVVPMLAFAAPVLADSPGSFSTGAGMYQVRNESQNQTTYKDSVSAACNETVKYTILLSNTANGAISNINVKTSLTTGVMTATGSNGSGTTTTSGTATVSVPSGASLSYVAGSTQVINYNDHSVIATLDDNITTSKGTSAGNLAGSTNEWVQYKAKVSCVTPPKEIQVCELSTKKVITINEDQFDSAKHTKDLSKCQTVTPPTVLANTGPGQVAGIVAATVVAATAGANFVLRRRAARQ
jgi:hypothetical protein